MANVWISGATGFVGRNLTSALLSRGHRVGVLVRAGSESRVPPGCDIAIGDPLDYASYRNLLGEADTLVHLVGVSHPSPAKAALFRQVDLPAAKAAVDAARDANIRHFVYVSVAHPAPVMKEYIAVRSTVEEFIRAAGLNATVLRPLVCVGARPAMAFGAGATLLDVGSATGNPRFGPPAGIGDAVADGTNDGAIGGTAGRRDPNSRGPGDPRRLVRGA